MPKVNLEEQYLWSGVTYGPGEAEVPDSFVEAYPQLKPSGAIAPPKDESVPSGEPNLVEGEAAPETPKAARAKKVSS